MAMPQKKQPLFSPAPLDTCKIKLDSESKVMVDSVNAIKEMALVRIARFVEEGIIDGAAMDSLFASFGVTKEGLDTMKTHEKTAFAHLALAQLYHDARIALSQTALEGFEGEPWFRNYGDAPFKYDESGIGARVPPVIEPFTAYEKQVECLVSAAMLLLDSRPDLVVKIAAMLDRIGATDEAEHLIGAITV
jgi:hypothetical protein